MAISEEVWLMLMLSLSRRIGRCSLKGTYSVEGCERRHHPQLHTAIGTPNLNAAVGTFHPSRTVVEDTPATGTPTTYATCGVIEDPSNVQRREKVALQMLPVILEGRNGIKIKAMPSLMEVLVHHILRRK